MTLNLLVASRHGIHLSGDFRLTYRNGTYSDDLSVQKIMPVERFGWTGLVSFSGLARTPGGFTVDRWLGDLCGSFNKRETLGQFLARIRSLDGTISRVYGDKRLTIVIAGFNGRKPFAAVMSNHEDGEGRPLAIVSNVLRQFMLKPRTVIARAFGAHDTVRRDELASLLALADRNDPSQLAGAIAALNTAASARHANSTISSECVVGWLDPAGNGWARPFGINEACEYLPPFVRSNLRKGFVGLLLKRGPSGQLLGPGWVQMGFTRKAQGVVKGKATLAVFELRNIESFVTSALPNGEPPDNFYAL